MRLLVRPRFPGQALTALSLLVAAYPAAAAPVATGEAAMALLGLDRTEGRIDDESYRIRFTPRRPSSNWSQINVRFAEELIAEGRMEPAGLAAFEARPARPSGGYTYEQDGGDAEAHVERELKKNRAAWAFFQAQPPWYRRTCARWVASAKKDETRRRRLATLVADSARERTVPPLTRPTGKKTAARSRSAKKK